MSKTTEEVILDIIQQLKEEMKYCDKSIDIRIVESALKKMVKALRRQHENTGRDGRGVCEHQRKRK